MGRKNNMESKLIVKEYKYIWSNDSSRYALITFRWNENSGEYGFERCDFFGVRQTYTVDDWAFLKDLATEVLSLCERGEV
jgi:hypothetical protein